MGKAGFGWKDNEYFLSLLESEYLRGIHREMSDVAENQKYKAEVWVKNSGLDPSLGIHFLESWKEMRLHRERRKKNTKNRRAKKTSGREVDRNRNPLRQKEARETEKSETQAS